MHFIVYDLEATCWRGRPPHGHNEVIEIGAVKVNRYGEVLGRFERFIKPKVNPILSSFCKQLTSISQEQVDGARHFPQVAEEFKEWIDIYDSEYVLSSWGGFDKNLLANDCDLHRVEKEWLDPHINIKKQYHDNKGIDIHSGLKATVKKEGFEFTGIHHRAISDAENLAKIVIKYIDEWLY